VWIPVVRSVYPRAILTVDFLPSKFLEEYCPMVCDRTFLEGCFLTRLKITHGYAMATVWGMLAVATATLVIAGKTSSRDTILSLVIDLILLAIVFMAGRIAKQQGARPWRVGAITGGIYVGAGSVVLWAEVLLGLHFAQLEARHLISWLTGIIGYVVIGLIVGAMGGFSVTSRQSSQDV